MTRKEEREQSAKNYWDESKYKSDLSGFPIEAFKAGAEWADRTMIDKTCRWLLEHGMTQHVIERYRKDMEE